MTRHNRRDRRRPHDHATQVRFRLLPGALVMAVGVAGCSASEAELGKRANDLPGVASVRVSEAEGDDAFVFENVPKDVRIELEPAASADEILGVLDAYATEMRTGNVGGVELIVKRDPPVKVASGSGSIPRRLANDVVAASADPTIREYSVTGRADEARWSIRAMFGPRNFSDMVTFVDRQRMAPGVTEVEADSPTFSVLWDTLNDDTRVTQARIDLALQIDRRFGLTGAGISGRGPLVLQIAAEDAQRAAAYVRGHSTRETRRIVINPTCRTTAYEGCPSSDPKQILGGSA